MRLSITSLPLLGSGRMSQIKIGLIRANSALFLKLLSPSSSIRLRPKWGGWWLPLIRFSRRWRWTAGSRRDRSRRNRETVTSRGHSVDHTYCWREVCWSPLVIWPLQGYIPSRSKQKTKHFLQKSLTKHTASNISIVCGVKQKNKEAENRWNHIK